MELLVYLFWLFVAGLIVGALARLLVPGTTGMGIVATALAGLAGSFIAGLISWYLVSPKEPLVGFILAVLCAAVIVYFIARPRVGYFSRYRYR
ncbi:MAG TPA: hypothetical protein VEK39_02395 [Solirubrobacterales bacterium]|nr:hypothetical protein [Solirubrobacterales bacterium]